MLGRIRRWLAERRHARCTTHDCADCPHASVAHWMSAEESPFGVEVLDCRPFATTMMATTADPGVAERFLQLRGSDGAEQRGRGPEGARRVACRLEYPYRGEVADGVVSKAQAMEDKWDIYLYEGWLYFTRSWTGDLVFRARIEFTPEVATVVAIETASSDADEFVVRQVDYLMKSHLFQRTAPHPLPDVFGRDAEKLAVYSFAQYGRRGLFGKPLAPLPDGRGSVDVKSDGESKTEPRA